MPWAKALASNAAIHWSNEPLASFAKTGRLAMTVAALDSAKARQSRRLGPICVSLVGARKIASSPAVADLAGQMARVVIPGLIPRAAALMQNATIRQSSGLRHFSLSRDRGNIRPADAV